MHPTWDRLTERAKKAVYYAKEEAESLHDNQVSSEHFLFGILRDDDSRASQVLHEIGCDSRELCSNVKIALRPKRFRIKKRMQFSPEGIRIISAAGREVEKCGHDFVGTEHLLLGIIAVATGPVGNALFSARVKLKDARLQVIRMHDKPIHVWPPPPSTSISDAGLSLPDIEDPDVTPPQ